MPSDECHGVVCFPIADVEKWTVALCQGCVANRLLGRFWKAFGNYLDVLKEVTFSPLMGEYLSFLRNSAFDHDQNYPDENYAREAPSPRGSEVQTIEPRKWWAAEISNVMKANHCTVVSVKMNQMKQRR